ncbi:MAG: hypothetical protein GY809_27280, partial [Planctomycetes bacterium]|nr:hypothetical protein [Planctomycetota bacterium]
TLAGKVNADNQDSSPTGFSAVLVGSTIIVNKAGTGNFTTTYSFPITLPAVPGSTVDVPLHGTPAVGEVWELTLDVAGDSRTYEHAVSDADGTVDTLAEVGAALLDGVNANLIKFVGDFGTSVAREVGIHDSVFNPQDIDTSKWNTNANPDITLATELPHLTILGTGDGNADFYQFEITDDMMQAAQDGFVAGGGALEEFEGLRVIFDVDHGLDVGDSLFWSAWLRLWEITEPLDPDAPKAPSLIASGPGFQWPTSDSGSPLFWDDYLEYNFEQSGIYFIEVTSIYPENVDGVPEGADYQLHVSIEAHAEDSFLFAPDPVHEDEGQNDTAQPLDPTNGSTTQNGDNFYTFYDPEVGDTDPGLDGTTNYTTPYTVIQSADSDDSTYSPDTYSFIINREMLTSPDTQLGDSLVDGSVYYTDITLTLAADQVNPTDEWL